MTVVSRTLFSFFIVCAFCCRGLICHVGGSRSDDVLDLYKCVLCGMEGFNSLFNMRALC